MKKRLKGLACWWLVLVMLVSTLATPAMAASSNWIYIYSGTEPLTSGDILLVVSDVESLTVPEGGDISTLAASSEGATLTGWNLWEFSGDYGSGFVRIANKQWTEDADYTLTADDITNYANGKCFVFEPLYEYYADVGVYIGTDILSSYTSVDSDDINNRQIALDSALNEQDTLSDRATNNLIGWKLWEVDSGRTQDYDFIEADGTLLSVDNDVRNPLLEAMYATAGVATNDEPLSADSTPEFNWEKPIYLNLGEALNKQSDVMDALETPAGKVLDGWKLWKFGDSGWVHEVENISPKPVASDYAVTYEDVTTIGDIDYDYFLILEPQWTSAPPHEHPVCGEEHTDIGDHAGECANVEWTAWDGKTSFPGGSVYLTKDIPLTITLTISSGTVNLCLNGQSINVENKAAITVSSGATLNICDCTGGGTINAPGSFGYGIYSGFGNSIVNIYGGTITSDNNGVYNKGEVTVCGGQITSTNGSAVNNDAGTVTVCGGTINGKTRGIYNNGTLYLEGAPAITSNTDGIYLASGKVINIGEGGLSNTVAYTVKTVSDPTTDAPIKIVAENDTDYSAKFAPVNTNSYRVVRGDDDCLYLAVKPKTYTVSFDANGGSGTMAEQTINFGTATALSENTFTRTGYTFAGWNTNADGTGTDYADKASVTDIASAGESITLYAKWSKIPATAPRITSAPQGFEGANALTYGSIGADKKLSVATDADENEYTVTYQWYKNTQNSKDGATAVSDGTSKDLAVESGLVAGDYYYYCKITVTRKDNDEATTVDTDLVKVTVNKATPGISAPTAKTGLVYDGTDKALVNAGTTTGGEMQYSLDGNTWGTAIPQGNSAGSYTVYYKVVGGDNYNDNEGGTVNVTISKASQSAPETPVAVNETIKAKADGKLTGVTSDMEYKLEGASEYTAISETEIANLAAGTYLVRYKEDANHFAGTDKKVIIEDGAMITATFNSNEGTAVESKTCEYNQSITAPAEPTKENFVFAGWYKDKECLNLWNFNSILTEDITLYAKWNDKPVYSISGRVTDGESGLGGITVTLKQGNTIIATTTTAADGSYSFITEDGLYNIVAEKVENDNSTIKTVKIEVTESTNVNDVVFVATDINSELEIKSDTPQIIVGGLDEEAQSVSSSNGNADVTVKMTVESQEDITGSNNVEGQQQRQNEQKEIKKESGNRYIQFIEINLTQSISGAESTKLEETSGLIEIIIPFEKGDKRNITVYRYHGSVAEKLGEGIENANSDGEYFEVKENHIVVYAKKFSTYAIGYDLPSGGGGSSVTRYTVKFDTDGGSSVSSATVTKNAKVTEPKAPEKEGYTFGGWYTDEELTEKYDFDSKVTKNFTLFAKWDKHDDEQPGTDTHNCPSLAFDDLDITKWYHLDTDYVIENGIFKGTTETTFEPNSAQTRAMMVTVLYRAEGEPAVNRSIPFADVDMGAYYANAVIWGQQNGIIKGYSETEFGPDDKITREQIAAIMHRYAQYKGIDVSVGENTNILSYDDFDSISEYAIPSIQWACGSGLIKGRTESTLNPKDNATRAEIAAILHRFIESNK